MTWFTTDDVDEFLATAGGFLRSRAAENTVLLTVADTLHTHGRQAYGDADPLFGWWHPADGAVDGAFLQTPPHPVLLAPSPQVAVTSLARTLAATGRTLPGVNASGDAAQAFATEWRRPTGATAGAARRARPVLLGGTGAPAPALPRHAPHA